MTWANKRGKRASREEGASCAKVPWQEARVRVREGETCSLLIKHIFILLYIENRLLTFSHSSVAQGSFHSFYLISFNNSLDAHQRKGANYLISTALLLCDHKTLLTSSTMGIPLTCHSDPVWLPVLGLFSARGTRTTWHQTLVLLRGKLSQGTCPQTVGSQMVGPGLNCKPRAAFAMRQSHCLPREPPKEECGLALLKTLLSTGVQVLWFPLRNLLSHASSCETPIHPGKTLQATVVFC